MTLYKNKYRSESHRLSGWDYSKESIYFITICTHEREYLFGEINDGEMTLNKFGLIVDNEIKRSIEIRDNMKFHIWIIMPNHIHLLIEIVDTHRCAYQNEDEKESVNTHRCAYQNEDEKESVNTHIGAYQNQDDIKSTDKHISTYLRRKPKSISSFVSGFKSTSAKQINVIRNTSFQKVWQNNYHDHIVPNFDSFVKIFNYIKENPVNWNSDTFK